MKELLVIPLESTDLYVLGEVALLYEVTASVVDLIQLDTVNFLL